MRRRPIYLVLTGVALLLAGVGGAKLYAREDGGSLFHDFLVMQQTDYIELVDAEHPAITAKARELQSLEEAYRFVRDEVAYAPYLPAACPSEALKARSASCLGKAALLCSLYRAMGAEPGDVRVVTGIVATPAGLTEHAWVDLEYGGECMQQDPTGLLGRFSFDEFRGSSFTDSFVLKENFCFNDEAFGIISQMNRMRSRGAE